MKRIFTFILLLSFCCGINAAVKFGVPLYDPPFAVDQKGFGVEGTDVQLVRGICWRLKWQCEFVPMRYVNLFGALQSKQIDFVIGGVVITDYRRLFYLFSLPYLLSEGGFVVLEHSPIKSIDDLQGKKIGGLRYREYYEYLQNKLGNQATVVPFNLQGDLILALANKEIDAAFINYYSALFAEHRYPAKIRILNSKVMVGQGLGIAALYSNKAEMEQINQVILEFQSDGTFIKSYEYNYGFFIGSP